MRRNSSSRHVKNLRNPKKLDCLPSFKRKKIETSEERLLFLEKSFNDLVSRLDSSDKETKNQIDSSNGVDAEKAKLLSENQYLKNELDAALQASNDELIIQYSVNFTPLADTDLKILGAANKQMFHEGDAEYLHPASQDS